MKTEHEQAQVSNADVSKLRAQLNALEPSPHQKNKALIQELMKDIEAALARGVTQKALVQQLKTMGINISLGGLRSQLSGQSHEQSVGSTASVT